MENKRTTAIKTRIADIVNGKFFKNELSSVLIAKNGKRISRCRVLATIVDKFSSQEKSFCTLTLDDSTSTIKAWAFKSNIFEETKKGDIIDVISKIREYQNDIYLLPEAVSIVEDPNTQVLRELELRKEEKAFDEKRRIIFDYQKQAADMEELKKILSAQFNIDSDEVESIINSSPPDTEENSKENSKEKILELISALDRGQGCEYTELLSAAGLAESVLDQIINELLEEGSCFEPRPGKIKRL